MARAILLTSTALILVVMYNGVMFLAAHRLDPAYSEVNHTWDVLGAISATLIALAEAESMQRNYMLSGDPAYLDGYDADRLATVEALSRLRRLTRDNPYQQEQADRLRRVLDDKFAFIDSLTVEHDKGGAARYDLARGHRLLRKARLILAEMSAEEGRLLRARDDRFTRWVRLIQYGILAVLIEQLTLLVAVVFSFAWGARRAAAA